MLVYRAAPMDWQGAFTIAVVLLTLLAMMREVAGPDIVMMGSLFVWGRGVPAGSRWRDVEIVDVHPTICRLLGLEPAGEIDGRPLAGIEAEPGAF